MCYWQLRTYVTAFSKGLLNAIGARFRLGTGFSITALQRQRLVRVHATPSGLFLEVTRLSAVLYMPPLDRGSGIAVVGLFFSGPARPASEHWAGFIQLKEPRRLRTLGH